MAACSRSRNDGQIVRDVQSKLYADSNIQSRKIAVQSSHGVITLSGYANQDAERIAAARDAAQVEGVKIVMNNLQVAAQPPAPALVAATTTAPVEAAAPAVGWIDKDLKHWLAMKDSSKAIPVRSSPRRHKPASVACPRLQLKQRRQTPAPALKQRCGQPELSTRDF